MPRDTRKADVKASLRGIARALQSFMGTVSEEGLPDQIVALSDRLIRSKGVGRLQMSQKSAKTAAELESMIMAELREHPACESAGVVIVGPMGGDWDTALAGKG